MISSNADRDLSALKQLIAIGRKSQPVLGNERDVSILRRLIGAAPTTAQRKGLTLFDAIDVLNLEQPHSDFLAWLLDPVGPLENSWLLRMLVQRVAPDLRWQGTPTVERESSVTTGRADIVVSWETFTLVIENKVWSAEGKLQVARYLDGFGIRARRDGCVIYLTPDGRSPVSTPSGREDCVTAMSYLDLAGLIEKGLGEGKQSGERGRVFAREFVICIKRLLKIRFDMTKPVVSEGTKLLIAHAKSLDNLRQRALEESGDYIEWMYSELERHVRPRLGRETMTHRWTDSVLFRLPEWKTTEVVFGISFAMRSDPRKRLITEQPLDPWVGISVCQPDGKERKSTGAPLSERLHAELNSVWKYPDDLRSPDYGWPLWRSVPIMDGDFERWTNEVIRWLLELTDKLSPTLAKVARTLVRGS
jgi:hypothetical protein